MEIMNNIITAFTTENPTWITIQSIPLTFIEGFVSMLLFTTILNIKGTKKQKLIYVLFVSTLGILCTFLIPKPFGNILTFIAVPISIIFIFKTNILKGIFAQFIPVFIIVIIELIVSRIFLLVFKTDYMQASEIPLYRLIINLVIYIVMYLLYRIIKYFKYDISVLDTASRKNKIVLITNTIFASIVLFIQIYLIVYYNDKLPSFIIAIDIIAIAAYFFISVFSLIKTMKLEKTSADLEQEKLYNQTLQILYDNIRGFKHDFSNIIAGIGGYVATKDMEGLEKYYNQLLVDCNQVNNLSTINPDTINNPAVYAVFVNKYKKASDLGINITLESFIDYEKLNMDIYEFTRIFGILMDNAIEAASECEEKTIDVIIRNEPNRNRQLLIIENTYKNKDINVDKIYEKGYSTKENNTGLGLWEVNKIISKHKNLSRFTSKTEDLFKQEIEIYNK